MNIFGIGPLEILLVLLLVLIIFGPRDLQKVGKMIGLGLHKLVQSDTWKTVIQASSKLKDLPNELMRQAGVDELKETIGPLQSDIQKVQKVVKKPTAAWPRESWEVGPENPGDNPAQVFQTENKPVPAASPENGRSE